MPRTRDQRLDNDKLYILHLYLDQKLSPENIRLQLAQNWAQDIQDIPAARTIGRRIKEWGVNPHQEGLLGRQARRERASGEAYMAYEADEVLIARIHELVRKGLTSPKILIILRAEAWPDINKRQLQRLRNEYNIALQVRQETLDDTIAEAHQIVSNGLASGVATDFGYGLLTSYVKARAEHFIPKQLVQAVIQDLDQEGVDFRGALKRRMRQEMRIPGPNFMWSADAYDKLKDYGIQIYGIIDAYSRFMLDLTVGADTHTAVSVQKYYIRAVKKYGYPRFTRTDMGAETGLMAECQGQFREAEEERKLNVSDFHFFGASVHNVRIEGWWSQLRKSQTDKWIKLFEGYKKANLFIKESSCDKKALMFVYMDVVRASIYETVETWNIHSIRKQPNRSYLPTGRPFFLYNDPAVPNYSREPQHDLLDELWDQVKDWDHERYLHPEVEMVCSLILGAAGLPVKINSMDINNSDHTRCYLLLRDGLHDFEVKYGLLPDLEPPRGASKWIERTNARRLELRRLIEIDRRLELLAQHQEAVPEDLLLQDE
ncbi:hypothetical protein ABW21_db0200482 [Orbilia brochopaga]|nr:hypothetical protein ABW21_db0200482 [Drechslerella brochopaga]